MRRAIFTVGILIGSLAAVAAEPRPVGRNCDLSSPPAEAGEETNHGMILRVFPRAKDIDSQYTGCQVLMVDYAGKWEVVALTEVVKGDPVRVWSAHESDQSRLACRFKNGQLVRGDPNSCPEPRFLLAKSLAPGCVQIIRDAVAKHGLGARRPSQCEYE